MKQINYARQQTGSTIRLSLLIAVLALCLGSSRIYAQVVNSTLSGTVEDSSGATLPGATIILTNQATGDKRTLTSNRSGLFSFAGLPSGNFVVTITAPGFKSFTEQGIHLDPGDSRALSNLKLQIGEASAVVTVQSSTDIPLDTGERSDLITAEQISHLSVEGRDVTELFKILPGFAIASQSSASLGNQAPDQSQVSVRGGALGNYSANGNPISGISLLFDGANITDPGDFGGGLLNVNYDQVAEVKVEVANFGADIANGPVVVGAVSKSGTDKFHGSLYTYARTYQLDSADALNGPTGLLKPKDREFYPGFTIGGPVLIPHTNFNRNRAFTFFAGAEDYVQRNEYAYGNSGNALVHALVPTLNMRKGDFSAGELQNYLGPLYNNGSYQNINAVPTYAKSDLPSGPGSIVNGQIPAALQDSGFQYIFNTYPTPNQTPTVANPYNWQSQDIVNNDLWQVLGRVDLAISQKNHLFARYTTERSKTGNPAALYYNPGELNTPGGGLLTNKAESSASNLTTVLSSTLTNQAFFNLIYLNQSFISPNPSILGNYPYQGAFANGRRALPMLGNYDDQSGLPRSITPDYSLGPIFARKFDPEAGDNVTKVLGRHTLAMGVYGTRVTNNQIGANLPTNGLLYNYYLPSAGQTFTDVDGVTSYTMSGNWVADNLEGFAEGYNQQNLPTHANIYFWNVDFFANDTWKVKDRLTVTLGARFEHLGLWNDTYGQGLAVFDPALIKSGATSSPFPGFLWHAIDKSTPNSGNTSYPLFVEPRVGFAYDVLGNGHTVLRGGWGEYRAHDTANSGSNAHTIAANTFTVGYGGAGVSLAGVSKLNLSTAGHVANTNTIGGPPNTTTNPFGVDSTPLSPIYGLTKGDREQPLTDTYSLTLNQALPYKMNLLIGYVGGNSRFLDNDSNNQTVALDNVNAIPIGGLFKPNPLTGQVLTPVGNNPAGATYSNTISGAGAGQVDQYRPLNTALVQYGALDIAHHVVFANYNALQLGLNHQSTHIIYNLNYTWSKALGVAGSTGNGFPSDPFDLYHNYGPEAFDRRHIANASYTFLVGKPVRNRFVGSVANGWEVSGITNFQTGVNIPTILPNPGLNLQGSIGQQYLANGASNPEYITISNSVYLGTPDVSLQPTILCSPTAHLAHRQYINGACFGTPSLGQNGAYQLPFLKEPDYFNSDLSAQKNVTFGREQSIQFRLSAFNFLNHPLPTLTTSFSNEYTLNATNPNGSNFNQGEVNQANTGFGFLPYSTGRRVLEISVKYLF